MVVVVAGVRTHAAVVHQEAHTEEVLVSKRGFVFQERFRWFLQLGLFVLLYGVVAGGLY